MSGERGSVLLEALVSTAIVAAVMATMLTAVSQADQRRREVALRRAALMVARSELAAVGREIPLRPGQLEGIDGDLAWRVSIEPERANALNGALAPPATVTVSVRAIAGGDNLATLRTLRVAPEP
jgi:type II secretory pathway pseudopilin PulG